HVRIGSTRNKTAFIMITGTKVMNGNNLLQTFPVARNGKSYGVILVLRTQGAGGQYQNFVGYRSLGNVNLTTFHDYAVLCSFLNAHIRTWIRLVGRSQHAVALHIRLSTAADKVFFLETGQPLLEVFMVIGLPFFHLIRFKGNVIDGIRAI